MVTLRFLLCATLSLASVAAAADKPNILLIMADDMGISDIGCYGGEIYTPTLDALAANGLRFSQFYNCARCCPTRAALLTGLYPHQAGIGHMMSDFGLPGYRGDLNEQCVTIAQVLKSAGYRTYMAGKWHVTKHVGFWTGDRNLTSKHNWPVQRGFDRFFGTIHGAGSYYDPVSLVLDNDPQPSPTDPNFYYTDAITDWAVRFIREHDEQFPETPFFCYVAYTSPHWPLHALKEDIVRYGGRYDVGWDMIREQRYRRMISMGLISGKWALSPRDPRVSPWSEEPHKRWQARRMEVYAAQVDRMDRGIRRIVETLSDLGKLDNTVIFFLADNGGCAEEIGPNWRGLHIPARTRDGRPVKLGNTPEVMPGPEDTYQSYGIPWANVSNTPFRRYKHWVHEGGISSPLIVHWPDGIAPDLHGRIVHDIGHVIDIMPTCVELAGATYPREYNGHKILPPEGLSLVPVLRGQRLKRPTALFWEHEGNRAVRLGRWKLVATFRGPWELYDMEADRTELHDLSSTNQDLVEELAALYEAWAQRANVVPWLSWRKPPAGR